MLSKRPNHLTAPAKLSSFYVLVSRVTKLDGLRVLRRDEGVLASIGKLSHDPELVAWTDGYDAQGTWQPALAAAAFALAEKRAATQSKAKPRAAKTTERAPAAAGATPRGGARGSAGPVASSVPAAPGSGPSTAAASLAPQPQQPNGDGSGSATGAKRRRTAPYASLPHTSYRPLAPPRLPLQVGEVRRRPTPRRRDQRARPRRAI